MTLSQAISFQLPRRRNGCCNWDDEKEFLMYVVTDIVAEDWEVQFPNGRIIDDFDDAARYSEGRFSGLLYVAGGRFDGDDSGSSGSAQR